MKERALKLGGTLTIDTRVGAGTRVVLLLPVEDAVAAEPAAYAERR